MGFGRKLGAHFFRFWWMLCKKRAAYLPSMTGASWKKLQTHEVGTFN
jgi:hypothetical protein